MRIVIKISLSEWDDRSHKLNIICRSNKTAHWVCVGGTRQVTTRSISVRPYPYYLRLRLELIKFEENLK